MDGLVSSCSKPGLHSNAMYGLLTVVAFLIAERGLEARRFQ